MFLFEKRFVYQDNTPETMQSSEVVREVSPELLSEYEKWRVNVDARLEGYKQESVSQLERGLLQNSSDYDIELREDDRGQSMLDIKSPDGKLIAHFEVDTYITDADQRFWYDPERGSLFRYEADFTGDVDDFTNAVEENPELSLDIVFHWDLDSFDESFDEERLMQNPEDPTYQHFNSVDEAIAALESTDL